MSTNNQLPSDTPVGSTLDEISERRSPLEQNPRRIMIGALVALVFGVIISIIFVNKNQKAKAASEAFGSAESSAELQAVVTDHPGSTAAGSALVVLAAKQTDDGQHETAIATLDQFLAEFGDHELVAQAILAKATIQMRLEQTDAALATLDTFDANHGDSPLAPLASVTRGDILKQSGNIEGAKQAYNTVPLDGQIDGLIDQRIKFLNFSSPTEVEPAPEPAPEVPAEVPAADVTPAEEAIPAIELTPATVVAPATDAAPAEESAPAADETTEG